MNQGNRSMRHGAYFEVLGSADEHDPAWRTVSAGLVVLRLVDAWVEDGADAVLADTWGIRAVRSAIDGVEPGPTRAVLDGIVDCMQRRMGGRAALLARVLAYARILEHEGEWRLAADAYATAACHSHPLSDCDLGIDAQIRMAVCLRQAGDLEGSAAAYRAAGELARAAGDLMGVLRACIGDAKIAMARGNLPQAESILDDTISRAAVGGLPVVHSMALHDRATVAALRGDYELSVRLAYDAYGRSQNPADRDRILGDIAASFIRLGVYSAARDALLILATTAQEQYVRWTAKLNLMEVGWRTGAQTQFELYRRELADSALPPYLTAVFHMMAADGHSRFGSIAEARRGYERAMRLASEGRYNQLVFDAEAGLRALDQKRSTDAAPRHAAELQDGHAARVAEALHEMWSAVEAGVP